MHIHIRIVILLGTLDSHPKHVMLHMCVARELVEKEQ